MIIPAAAAAVGLAWTLTKIIEKWADWKEDRAIKRLQRRSLELDIQRKEWELRQLISENIGTKLLQRYPREAQEIKERVVRDAIRLGTNEQLLIDKSETLDTINRK